MTLFILGLLRRWYSSLLRPLLKSVGYLFHRPSLSRIRIDDVEGNPRLPFPRHRSDNEAGRDRSSQETKLPLGDILSIVTDKLGPFGELARSIEGNNHPHTEGLDQVGAVTQTPASPPAAGTPQDTESDDIRWQHGRAPPKCFLLPHDYGSLGRVWVRYDSGEHFSWGDTAAAVSSEAPNSTDWVKTPSSSDSGKNTGT